MKREPLTPEQIERWKANRQLPAAEVLKQLPGELLTGARVVGRWVWYQSSEKPSDEHRKLLSGLGFKWNRERQVWQHPCGKFSVHAPYNPEDKYQTTSAAEFLRA